MNNPAASPFITVVSGLPRSGTSMMMQMLEAGGVPILSDGIRTPDPDNPRGYYELEAVKATKRDASWVAEAPGKAVKVIHLLLPFLPPTGVPYRVIMMRRPIDQILRSQAAMLARAGKPEPPDPEMLAKVFTDQMAKAKASITNRKDFSHIEVDYAGAVSEPRLIADQLAKFLPELNLDPINIPIAVDPSLQRQRC